MAFAREIFQKIKLKIRFQQSNKEADSHYTILGNTLVRVSNHCTWMYVWDNYFEQHPEHKGMPIVSIVFEDSGNTFSEENLVLKRLRRPIKVMEYVYPISGNPKYIGGAEIKLIIQALSKISGGIYTDLTNKCQSPILRVSKNPQLSPSAETKTENKQYTNMNKKLIRLTESDLHRVIKESVYKILNESCWYGDTKPFETIYRAAQEIVDKLEYVNDNEYEEWGDDYRYSSMYDWAKRVANDAEYYIRNHSSNVSINGGEDW